MEKVLQPRGLMIELNQVTQNVHVLHPINLCSIPVVSMYLQAD